VRDGTVVTGDEEGFSAGHHRFDSDITAGRCPRAALALAGHRLLAVACDGRADDEAGLTLGELAGVLGRARRARRTEPRPPRIDVAGLRAPAAQRAA
jgi:hypothetical protein